MASMSLDHTSATSNLKAPAGYPKASPSEEPTRSTPESAPRVVAKDIPAAAAWKRKPRGNVLYFRTDASPDLLGTLSLTPLDALDRISYSSELSCAHVQ